MVDGAALVGNVGRVVGADFDAGAAADAKILIHRGLAGGVHFHLAGPGAAAHAQVFQGAAKAGTLMALEMVEGDDDVGVHNGPANFGGLAEDAAMDRHFYIVGALEAVADENLAAGGVGAEAVAQRRVQMIQGVFPGADVEGVAVGEEGIAPQLLDVIGDVPGKVGAEKRQIAQLAEVNFNGHIFSLEIDLVHTCGLHQLPQLRLVILSVFHAKIGKIYS